MCATASALAEGSATAVALAEAVRLAPAVPGADAPRPARSDRQPFPIVSERERIAPPMSVSADQPDIEMLLRRIIREEGGVRPWRRPRNGAAAPWCCGPATALQEKTWPIETFFHKVVMIRNRLRTLEQQVNGMDVPEDVKVKLQSYISGCYGSLTSFNVLFADEDDQFKGAAAEAGVRLDSSSRGEKIEI